MCSISSQELEASVLDSSGPECERSHSAKPATRNGRSLPEGGRMFPASPMWRRYAQLNSADKQSTLLPEASHARTCLTLEDVPGLRASAADYGLTSPVSFARYDRASHSWRTSQACLVEGWEKFSQTWPQAGTTRNGTAFRLRPLAPLTYERESGFLPTPVASETKRTTPYSQGGQSLSFVLGGRPSQALLEWMMGFPDGWLAPQGMPLSRKSSKRSAAQS
jgi:hypothetical protein